MAIRMRGLSAEVRAGIAKRIWQIVVMVVFIAAVLFISAGRLDWPWAWGFLALYVAVILANAYFLLRASPETTARRATAEGVKRWDQFVGGLWALVETTQLVVAGLDSRFGWTAPLSLPVHGAGLLIYLDGATLTVQDEHTGDPRFQADGYHLSAHSAARDKGKGNLDHDVDGHLRDAGNAKDLGADEFVLVVAIGPESAGELTYVDTHGDVTITQCVR